MAHTEAEAHEAAVDFLAALHADFANGREVRVFQSSAGEVGTRAVLAATVFEDSPLPGPQAYNALQAGIVYEPADIRRAIVERAGQAAQLRQSQTEDEGGLSLSM